MRRRRVSRRFRRTIVTAVLSLGLVLGLPLVAAHGEEAPAFTNGKATAISQVLTVAPGVGSLQIGAATGRSVSQLVNHLAQAQAQSIDLGLIGTSLTSEQCDGSAPPLRPDQLPQPTTTDNRNGDSVASSDEFPLAGSTLGGGRQTVAATRTPAAVASVDTLAASIGPVAQLSAGRSFAATRIVDNDAREAEARVSVDLDLAGVVHLRGLEWRAFHRTGADPTTSGTFTVASAQAGAVPLATDQLGALQNAVNAALAETGISIALPRVDHLTTPNDLVRVTPLTITLKDSPLGKTALGPGLNLTHTQREQLFDAVAGVSCKLAAELLVGDITVSVASGTGFLTMSVGGAEAATGDLPIGNPFGDVAPFALPAAPTAPLAPAPVAVATAAPANTTAAAQPVASVGPLDALCRSVHPSRRPGCSRGVGAPLAAVGVLATAGMGYLDWRRQRRMASAEPVS